MTTPPRLQYTSVRWLAMSRVFLATLCAFVSLLSSGCVQVPLRQPRDLSSLAMETVHDQANSVTAALAGGVPQAKVLDEAMAAVAHGLKDPGSAQFRGVHLSLFAGKKIVCGEVNAKNSFGGYTGFSRFSAGIYSASLEQFDARYPGAAAAANTGIRAACGG